MGMRSIKTHLTVTLLLCILLPTGLIGATAYWFVYNSIKENRIKDVGRVADTRYEELRTHLQKDNERGKALLDKLISVCSNVDGGINDCVRTRLEQFAAINHVAGFTFRSGVENELIWGSEAIPFDELNKTLFSGQIATISTVNGNPLLSLIATDQPSGFSLVTTYPAQELQKIFTGSNVLGQSGETFLADNRGLFVTKPRYPSQQGIINPISALPMQHCLHNESGETLNFDYRGVPIIHGFRFVPEIGGGCIMAHIDQSEAFAPLTKLVISLSGAVFFFACSAWLIAAMVSRSMSKPIIALTDMAQALSRGDFTQRISLAGYREIAELSQLFNRMTKQLDNTVSQLKSSEYELEQKIAERTAELYERHRKYRSVIRTTGEGFWQINREGRLLEANPAYALLSGYSEAELVAMRVTDLEAQESPEKTAEHIRYIMAHGTDMFETRHRRKDGSVWDVEVNASFIDEDGGYFVCFFRDITESKRAKQELRIAATAFETLEGITITDANEIIVRVNQAFTQITGYSSEEVIGKKPSILKSGHHDQGFYSAMRCALQNDGQWEGEIWDRHKDGHIYPKWLAITAVKDDFGCVTHYIGNFTDITERKASEEKIKSLAFYDTLTELANRRLLTERLDHALAIQARTENYGALLFLDLDNFKLLNDTQGHGIGDELLVEVARRLKTCVRETDTLARLGGDEFIVLLGELGAALDNAAVQVKTIAEKIVSALAEPYVLSSVVHNCSSSIGIVLFCDGGTTANGVLAQADTAMYAAKKSGKNTYRFFDPAMQQELEQRTKFESALRRAVDNEQLQLFYQPQVDHNKQMIGVEALIRWDHPELGLVLPIQFIPLAEETDLILTIGRWVLETACAQLKAWKNLPLAQNLSIAVNVSAKQFYQPGFVKQVQEIMAQYAIEPKQLKLELTESMVLKEIDTAIAKMLELKSIGVVLAMDDFGTGYSSLSYLKNLPFDQIKIDKSFMDNIIENNKDAYIIHSVITLGKLMEITVIAEGVEDIKQDELLKSLGCTIFQGYLFGKPIPAGELERLLLSTPKTR
ncbi:EAL domain-containing protein [Candidatus Methylobacter oryzae]|uniref:EAL domain-containing protein n=2 Tax=Candidatus Methylobacter oryzae TaxID=2497749 RepID=A0ABY3CAH7_9GAMM|nr:EAL domain-containing protein [Candidatus Methylobacter oryzae]